MKCPICKRENVEVKNRRLTYHQFKQTNPDGKGREKITWIQCPATGHRVLVKAGGRGEKQLEMLFE